MFEQHLERTSSVVFPTESCLDNNVPGSGVI